MKLVFISCIFPPDQNIPRTGGPDLYSKNMISNVPFQSNDQVYFLANMYRGEETYRLKDNVEVRHCWQKGWKFPFQLINQLRQLRPDLVHIQHELRLYGGQISSVFLFLVYVYLRLKKIPVITTVHGVVSLNFIDDEFVRSNNTRLPIWMIKSAFYVIYKLVTVLSQKVVVHETSFRRTMVEDYGVPAERVEVINHYVEQTIKMAPREEARQQLKLPLDGHICLFFGFISGYKGLPLLIDGFAKYTVNNPKAFLIIAGGMNPNLKNDKPYQSFYNTLQERAVAVIPNGQYRWVGFVGEEEISVYYGASDVCVIPYSVYMGTSGPLAFSLAYGADFLVSDALAEDIQIPEIVFRQTADSLATKLGQYFKGEIASAQSKMKALAEYRSMPKVTEKTYQLYKQLYGSR
ncbi:MAG: glycosyltransferase [bacterium]